MCKIVVVGHKFCWGLLYVEADMGLQEILLWFLFGVDIWWGFLFSPLLTFPGSWGYDLPPRIIMFSLLCFSRETLCLDFTSWFESPTVLSYLSDHMQVSHLVLGCISIGASAKSVLPRLCNHQFSHTTAPFSPHSHCHCLSGGACLRVSFQ